MTARPRRPAARPRRPAWWWALRPAAYLWAAPTTAVGLAALAAGLATGGRARWVAGAAEVSGGCLGWWLRDGVQAVLGLEGGAAALTLGHVILGQDEPSLDLCRRHEHVHVRQAEWFGPLFLPAYLACSVVVWLLGGDPYRGNPFERQAYALERIGPE